MIPEGGEAFTHDEIYALWGGFGVDAGARYEVRKHETFRIESVETDRFVANLPHTRIPVTSGGASGDPVSGVHGSFRATE